MNTNDLHVLWTLSKIKNARKTAEYHRMSHVNVLRIVKSLTDEFGIQFVKKEGRELVFTKEGIRFIEKLHPFFEEEKKLYQHSKKVNLKEIKIATFEVFSTHFSPYIVSEFHESEVFQFLERSPGSIEKSIKLNEVDYGLSYFRIPEEGIEHLEVGRLEMGIFGLKKFLTTPFDQLEFVVPVRQVEEVPNRMKGLDGWDDGKSPRKIKFKVELLETAFSLVSSGFCVGYFPKFLIKILNKKYEKSFQLHELMHSFEFEKQSVFFIKRQSDEEDSTSKKIVKSLRMHLKTR